jgi:hypothetical protein
METAMTTSKAKHWRDVLSVHPAAELFPLMPETELRELGEDIKRRGLLEQPVFYRDPELGVCVLDGRNRLDACELIGRSVLDANNHLAHHWHIREATRSFDPVAFVCSKNLHRRHLTSEQKRDLIAKVLKATPATSNRQIAKRVKADDKTVAKVRAELESTAEIPQLKATIGKDGKTRKATRSVKATAAKVKTPAPLTSKRTTAHDVIELWMQMPPEEDRRVFEAIGLRRILGGLPEAWMPELEKWIEECRSPAPPAELGPGHQIPDDLSIPEFMRRSA